MQSIGDGLRAWRELKNLSQKDAATQLRVAGRTYQDYERNLRAPGAESMEAFVRAGINANWLLTGEGPMLLADLQGVATAPASIDTETLTYVIEEVEKALHKRRGELPPARKAVLIQLIYDYCADLGKKDPGVVERFLKLVA